MPVRFGLIGCGKITERLALPQLTACRGARVAALVDVDRPAAQRLVTRFGLQRTRVWTDWARMLREADVDAVGVCVPNHLHAEIAVACCEAGKHVIIEKPIALTLREADRIIAAAKAAKVRLMVEQSQRFHPVHETAKRELDSGRLGRVHALRGYLGHAGPEYWSRTSPWFVKKRQSGGGALIDVGTHIVDLLRWLSGKTVARVCATARTMEKAVLVEDNATGLLEFSDGATGSFDVSWTRRPYDVATDFYARRGTLRTALSGAHPVVVRYGKTDGDPNQLRTEHHPTIPAASRRGGAYPYFVTCIQTGAKPFVSGEEGRAALEVVLACYESIRTRGWVALPL